MHLRFDVAVPALELWEDCLWRSIDMLVYITKNQLNAR
jgi:hypothetical protein